jgi:hypothetical protein
VILSTVLEEFADATTRALGASIRQRGHVLLVDDGDGDGEIGARVIDGKESHEVRLSVSPDCVGIHCTCAEYARTRQFCPHAWAVLLEVEDDMLGDPELDLDLVPSRSAPSRWPSRAGGDGDVRWRQALTHVRRALAPEEAQSPTRTAASRDEVLYVLDGVSTRRRGVLTMRTFVRSRKADGSCGRPRPRRVRHERLDELVDPLDRRLWALLLCGKPPGNPYYARWEHEHDNEVQVSVEAGDTLLPILVETGRLYFADDEHPHTLHHRLEKWSELSRDSDQRPWSFRLRVDPDASQWLLGGHLVRGEQDIPLSKPWLLLAGGWVVDEGRLARLDDHGAFPWISLLRQQGGVRIPKSDGDALLETVLGIPRLPPVDWPDELRLDDVATELRPGLRIETCPGDTRKVPRLRARLCFEYDGVVVPDHRPGAFVVDLAKRRRLRRDLEREAACRRLLGDHGFRPPPRYLVRMDAFETGDLELHPKRLAGAVLALTREGFHVEAEGKIYRRAAGVNVSVSSGIDWFDVHVDAQFEGATAPLPELLRALKRGEGWVTLDDGTAGVLPAEWLEKHGLLLASGKLEDGVLRFRRSQAFLLDVLLSTQERLSVDAAFEKARGELKSFEGVRPEKAGEGFRGTLRPYQEEGLGWLRFLERFSLGGCLADDMGLGKTVQVLAHLASRGRGNAQGNGSENAQGSAPRKKPSLVVVPRSLVFNWKAEARRFTPDLRVLDFTGPGRVREVSHLDGHDLVVTTYGTLVRDAEFLKDVAFDYAILDEAQTIKNASTTFAKAARLLRAEHRLALSGTPIENHLGELWSLFEFLNPGMLGAAAAFRRFTGNERNLSDESLGLVARALRPMVLRRTKGQVAADLPARTEQLLVCELEPEDRRLYDELREHYRSALLSAVDAQGMARAKIQVLEALLRMRQAACHPGLIDRARRAQSSAKLELLAERLGEVVEEGHKALVFSQFTRLLGIVRERLERDGVSYEYLDGRTRRRDQKLARFQEDADCKVFLVSLKAGGLGLNLTAAEYVFLLDPWWNPAAENQAIDRAHRIGQTRNVVAYRLIVRDTVEEKVLELQERKRRLAASILGSEEGILRSLRREDLELLLG